MNARHRTWLLIPAIAIAACSQPSGAGATQTSVAAPAVGKPRPSAARTNTVALPKMIVTRSPTCGCCEVWIEHARHAGFAVEVRETEDLNAFKERLGVPYGKGACHTAEVAGYFVEGHVPLDDVKRLIAEKPRAKGLTVPGMPMGSPGMEMPDGRVQPYSVELVAPDGTTSVYARHGQG